MLIGGIKINCNAEQNYTLVDWSGRILREDKKGAIANNLPGILQRLDMDAKQFIYLTRNSEHPFKNLIGAVHHVRKACESIGQNWVHGYESG